MDFVLRRRKIAAETRRTPSERLVCQSARDHETLLAACQLTYAAYLRAGLARPNRFGLRVLPHQLLETITTFVAIRSGRVAGTLSMVADGEQGLPMDVLYSGELARLRHSTARIAELTCLATSGCQGCGAWKVLRGLLQAALHHARTQNIDQLTICVHPRYREFYHHRLGFREFGPMRACPWVCSRAAIGMYRPLSLQVESAFGHGRFAGPSGTEVLSICPDDATREFFQRLLPEAAPHLPAALQRAAA